MATRLFSLLRKSDKIRLFLVGLFKLKIVDCFELELALLCGKERIFAWYGNFNVFFLVLWKAC